MPTAEKTIPTVIEWKVFWTLTATLLSLVLAVLTATGLLLAPLAGLLALGMAGAVTGISYLVVDACEMWRGTADEHRRRIWLGISGTAGAYMVWTLFAVLIPMTWRYGGIMAVALGLLSVGTYWSARYVEWWISRAPAPRTRGADPEALLGRSERILAAAIRLAGIKFVTVLPGVTHLRSDAGSQFRVRRQAGAQNELTSKSMELIAIALAEITGKDVHSSWVRCRKEAAAGVYSITITNRDVMAEVIPYVDDPTPTSIAEPALVGVEIDGREHRERLDQHSRAVGGSTSGKSSLLQCEIAHATRCEDAIVWVGGVQKLYDLVAGWVEPYHGKNMRPPLDWIGHGQTDTLSMMAAGMSVARWRQRQPMHLRHWRTILLYLDEFSFVAQSSQKIWLQGEWWTASRLASGLLRGAASGNVYVKFGSQRATVDHYGDQGGDVVANIGVNYAFRSKDFAEVGRLTNDYKLPVPGSSGECYRFSDTDPLHLKAPYIQTNDPSKPRLHNGVTLAEIAWSRRHITRGGLTEAEGLAAAGPAYAARHQVVDDRFMTYLTNGEDTEDATEGQGEVFDAVTAQLAELAAGLDLSDKQQPSEPRRPDAILTVLDQARTENPDGMTAAQVAEALNTRGDQATAEAVAATLSRMCNRGQINRVGHGRYTALDQTNDQTNT